MKKILWLAIVGLILFATSCKKEVTKSGAPDASNNSDEVINDSIFHFTALANGVEIKLEQDNGAPDVHLKYALYKGGSYTAWTVYSAGQTVTLPNVGDKLYFKADKLNYAFGGSYVGNIFSISNAASVSGNIMYLLTQDGTTPEDFATNPGYQYAFSHLFQNNKTLISADNLILPATTLAEYCYVEMFGFCTSLTTAPVLPADALVEGCYQRMFQGCSNLQSVTMLATKNTEVPVCLESWLDFAGTNVAGTKYVYVAVGEGTWEYDDIQMSLLHAANWQLAPYVP